MNISQIKKISVKVIPNAKVEQIQTSLWGTQGLGKGQTG